MIKQDQGTTTLDGSVGRIMSECSALIYYSAKCVAESVGTDITEVLEELEKGVRMYSLTESGMSVEEVAEILGLDSQVVEDELDNH